jgi:hypothetical protein
MNANEKLHESRNRSSPSFPGWLTALFIALLTVLMYLLAADMKRHHFCSGAMIAGPARQTAAECRDTRRHGARSFVLLSESAEGA